MLRTQPQTFMNSRFLIRESLRSPTEHISIILAENHSVPVAFHQVYLSQTIGRQLQRWVPPSSWGFQTDTLSVLPGPLPRRRYPRDPSRKSMQGIGPLLECPPRPYPDGHFARRGIPPSVLPGLLPRRHPWRIAGIQLLGIKKRSIEPSWIHWISPASTRDEIS